VDIWIFSSILFNKDSTFAYFWLELLDTVLFAGVTITKRDHLMFLLFPKRMEQ
jgi:hypothetical protein